MMDDFRSYLEELFGPPGERIRFDALRRLRKLRAMSMGSAYGYGGPEGFGEPEQYGSTEQTRDPNWYEKVTPRYVPPAPADNTRVDQQRLQEGGLRQLLNRNRQLNRFDDAEALKNSRLSSLMQRLGIG